MKTFRYEAFDGAGVRRRGLVEADDPRGARLKLAESGLYPEWLTDLNEDSARAGARGLREGERGVLYRELAALLKAGTPLMQALQALARMPEFERGQAALAAARDRIREGAGLGEALERAGAGLSVFERAAMDAGVKAGRIEESLEGLAGYLLEQQELRGRIAAALTYPAVILVFAVLVAGAMLGFVLPATLSAIGRTGIQVEWPRITRVMLGLRTAGLYLAPALAVGAAAAAVWWRRRRRDAGFRIAADRLRFRLPVAGRGHALLVNLRFARTFAMALRGGVAAEEGLALAGRACGSEWVAALAEREGEAVRHGSNLTDAIARIPPLAPHLPSWVETGEAGGVLAEMMEHAANRIQGQWGRYVARALGLLEPGVMAVVGAFVFAVALAIILPLVAMNQGVLAG